jgi:hypothetical protein
MSAYEGHDIVDLRTWFTAADGALRSGKGLACSVRHLPELTSALNEALAKARELGLVGAGGDDGEGRA